MSKDGEVESSVSERPRTHGPRRLADWINPTGAKKVHSLVDKIYKMESSPKYEVIWGVSVSKSDFTNSFD